MADDDDRKTEIYLPLTTWMSTPAPSAFSRPSTTEKSSYKKSLHEFVLPIEPPRAPTPVPKGKLPPRSALVDLNLLFGAAREHRGTRPDTARPTAVPELEAPIEALPIEVTATMDVRELERIETEDSLDAIFERLKLDGAPPAFLEAVGELRKAPEPPLRPRPSIEEVKQAFARPDGTVPDELEEALRAIDEEAESAEEPPEVPLRARVVAAVAAGESCAGWDLGGADLSDLRLEQADFSNAILTGANLHGSVLDGSMLAGALLGGADLGGASLANTNANGADFTDASAERAIFDGASLEHAIFRSAKLAFGSFRGVRAKGIDAVAADLTSAVLDGAEAPEADFTDCTIGGASFRGATLVDAFFERARGEKVDFTEADFSLLRAERAELPGLIAKRGRGRGARFPNAMLRGANFSFADLEGADFTGALLKKAELEGCPARRARFDGADLSEARLLTSDFFEARFERANLHRADLRGCNLFGAELWNASVHEANLELADRGRTKLA